MSLSSFPTIRDRYSFATLDEALSLPDLIAIQSESFEWFLENGLADTFRDISPITDFSETLNLELEFDPTDEDLRPPPKFTVEECKERDMTYSAPIFVRARFFNANTGEIKEQTVFMGDFPKMTDKGTFVINGTERVVVSQLVRSPGAYFERTPDKTTDKDIYTARIIPSRGAWFELEIDRRDQVSVRLDRRRKQPVTVLLKALGWTEARIREEFGQYDSMMLTLEKDGIEDQDEALKDIYRKLRPGEPVSVDSAQNLLANLYFTERRYDLAKVGRYKLNRKLGVDAPLSDPASLVLTEEDVTQMVHFIAALHNGDSKIKGTRKGEEIDVPVEIDDIDHFGNRRIRAVGELLDNQIH